MEYKKILIEKYGYQEFEADITVEDICKLDVESKKVMEKYFNGLDVDNYSCGEFSVKKLHEEKGLNVIAAIISISNLKKDYNKYSELYNRGFK